MPSEPMTFKEHKKETIKDLEKLKVVVDLLIADVGKGLTGKVENFMLGKGDDPGYAAIGEMLLTRFLARADEVKAARGI